MTNIGDSEVPIVIPTRSGLLNKAEAWEWLKTAPLPVVLSICLTTTGALATWVWAVAGEVNSQRASVAVAVEQAQTAVRQGVSIENRLMRLEDKLDKLMIAIERRTRTDKEKVQ